MNHAQLLTYRNTVIYQVYPKSFADSNGDGIGDIQGIISKLNYIKSLSVDAIWISPCFPSPEVDNGYDISDYKDIAPEYGTLADIEELIEKAGKLGIGIILDLVANHTSSQHEWFQRSRMGKITNIPISITGRTNPSTTGKVRSGTAAPGSTTNSVNNTTLPPSRPNSPI